MIARTTDFSAIEDKFIGFDAQRVNFITLGEGGDYGLYFKDELKVLLNAFYLLLEKYPDALREETILKRYEQLKSYALKRNAPIANCQSYCDRRRTRNQVSRRGIRMIPNADDSAAIQITNYDFSNDGLPFSKSQLNLALYNEKLCYNSLIIWDGCSMEIADRKSLTYLKPNILTKHL